MRGVWVVDHGKACRATRQPADRTRRRRAVEQTRQVARQNGRAEAPGHAPRPLARGLQAAPEPRAAEFLTRLMTVTDVSVLPDGRVAAFVVFNEPLLPPGGPETLLFVFANQDGQWLVDDWIDFSIVPANFGAEATPAP